MFYVVSGESLLNGKGKITKALNSYVNFLERNETALWCPWLWQHGRTIYSLAYVSLDENCILLDTNKTFYIFLLLLLVLAIFLMAIVDIFAAIAIYITLRRI